MNMHDMIAAIEVLCPKAQYSIDYTIQVTNDVPTLLTWKAELGAQPSQEQIQTTLDSIQLEGYKRLQATVIEASYQNATYNTAIGYMGTTWWTDQNSQSMLMGALVVFGATNSVPEGFQWWDATNTGVPMTLQELQGLSAAILTRVNTNFVKRKTLLANITAATTVAAVQAIIWP